MAKIVKLSSLRIGEIFHPLPAGAQSIFTEGITIYNCVVPTEYYIFSSFDRWSRTCKVYHFSPSASTCEPHVFHSDILVLKF